jgi:hypothetical protein
MGEGERPIDMTLDEVWALMEAPREPMARVPEAELARLRAIEAAARAYRDEFLRQFAAVEDGTFTWHAEEYNARNQVRHALFEALDGA